MRDLLGENELLALQFFNFAFVAADNRLALRIHDTVEKLDDLLLDQHRLTLHSRRCFMDLGLRLIPPLAEQFGEQREQFRTRNELAEH
ncbi:hypothetical protein [Sphingobium sp. B11D3D]|uniref:hypothetical protein n=1 Tax=Sphingobium sp. B11D3D TaxID=2940576 RepID=UPI0022243AB6|nr:hypothetical protein [Sphingobium sp. B11D3D]